MRADSDHKVPFLKILSVSLIAVSVMVLFLIVKPKPESLEDQFGRHMAKANQLMMTNDGSSIKENSSTDFPLDITEASGEYQQALAIKPSSAEAIEGLGTCNIYLTDYFGRGTEAEEVLAEEALFFLMKAVTKVTDRKRLAIDYGKLSDAYLILGRVQDAKKAEGEYVRLYPDASALEPKDGTPRHRPKAWEWNKEGG